MLFSELRSEAECGQIESLADRKRVELQARIAEPSLADQIRA